MQPAKRTRIDPSVVIIDQNNPAKSTPTTAPLAVAEKFLTEHLSSLHPEINTILSQHGKTFIKALHRLHNKAVQVEKMKTDEEFFPRSARFEFRLHLSKEAEQCESYGPLQEKVTKSLLDMKSLFKGYVVEATNIEISTNMEKIRENHARNIRHVAQAFRLAAKEDDLCPADTLIAKIYTDHHEVLLKHLHCSFDDFKSTYCNVNGLEQWPVAPSTTTTNGAINATRRRFAELYAAHHSQSQSQTSRFSQSQEENTDALSSNNDTADTRLAEIVKRTLEATFVTSWEQYLKQVHANEIALNIKKLKENERLAKATEETAEDVNMEPSAAPEKLEELVAKKTKEETKKLRNQMSTLADQMKKLSSSLKNEKRGQSGASKKEIRQRGRRSNKSYGRSRASSPKSRSPKRTPKNQKKSGRSKKQRSVTPSRRTQRRRRNSDDDSDNDSSKNNVERRKKTGRPKFKDRAQ